MAKLYGQDPNVDFAATNLMSFGKSFSRLNGQPLDKSEVWYNDFEALKAYAKTEAAYVGQKVSYIQTFEDGTGTVTHYSIEVDGTLKPLGNQESIDNINTLLTGENGLVTRVETLETNMPTEEQIQQAVNAAVAAASNLRREILDEVPSEEKPLSSLIDVNSENALNTIYMVKTGLEDDSNKYNEYIVIEKDGNRFIEPVGSWEVNLNDYVTKEEFSKIPRDGERNVINSVDTAEFNINNIDPADRQLQINKIAIKKVEGLEDLLNEKRNTSDKVPIEDISGLNDWLTENGSTLIKNIGVGNLDEALQAKINSSISQVNEAQFSVVNGVLNLKSSDEIGVTLADFNKVVGDLNTLLTNDYNVYNEIESIKSILTWDTINS